MNQPTIYSLEAAQQYLTREDTPRVGDAFRRAAADVLPHAAVHGITTGALLLSGALSMLKGNPLGLGRALHGALAEVNIAVAQGLGLMGRTMAYEDMKALQDGVPVKDVEARAANPTLWDRAIENRSDNLARGAIGLCALMTAYSVAEGDFASAYAAQLWLKSYEARLGKQPSKADIEAGVIPPMQRYAQKAALARPLILLDAARRGSISRAFWQVGGMFADHTMAATRTDGYGRLARQPNPEQVAEGLLTAPSAFAPAKKMLGLA